jgi:DNA-binding NarL/FixJ family response regulator
VTLDAAALGNLRAIVRKLEKADSLAQVVELARSVEVSAGVTVDFDATRELGQPLVVLRVPSSAGELEGLTPREHEVASLIADGLSNKEIAARLRISVGTVKYYVHQILDKTGLPGRVAIATSLRGGVR